MYDNFARCAESNVIADGGGCEQIEIAALWLAEWLGKKASI